MSPHFHAVARASWQRSLIKTIAYRIISASSTILVAGLFFNSWALAGAFGVIDLLANTTLYYVYERAWAHLDLNLDRKSAATSVSAAPAIIERQ